METNAPVTLRESLSPIHVCALALGCIVGWIGFVAPGAEYLPEAGPGGTLLSYAALAAALTGLIGFFTASSRLLWAMSRGGVLSPWFGRLSRAHRTPRNAILFVAAVSMVAPVFGRNVLGWLSDLCSLGAAVAYGYTSAAALLFARREGVRRVQATGVLGIALALTFALLLAVPVGLGCEMKPHTWALLGAWAALGLLFRLAAGRRHHPRAESAASAEIR